MSTDRDDIARTLGEAWITSGPRAWDDQSEGRRQGAYHLADALLPVVDRIANERAAAELRKAAYALTITDRDTGIRIIGDRADALGKP